MSTIYQDLDAVGAHLGIIVEAVAIGPAIPLLVSSNNYLAQNIYNGAEYIGSVSLFFMLFGAMVLIPVGVARASFDVACYAKLFEKDNIICSNFRKNYSYLNEEPSFLEGCQVFVTPIAQSIAASIVVGLVPISTITFVTIGAAAISLDVAIYLAGEASNMYDLYFGDGITYEL
jgi:hypothetical protein